MSSNNRDESGEDTRPSQDMARRPSLVSSRTLSESGGRRPSQQHVRFSSDLDRSAVEEQQREPFSSTDRRPSSRGLTIDTALTLPTTARPAAQSPTSPLSPGFTSPSAVAARSAVSPTSPDSTGRSRSRNRGYSLRRSIFNRNISTQSEDEPVVVDVDLEANSPSKDGAPAAAPLRPVDEKNELAVTPTVTSDSPAKALAEASTYPSSTSDRPIKESFSISVAQDKWVKRTAIKEAAAARIDGVLTTIRKTILRIKDIPPTEDGRHIDLNPALAETLLDERTGKPYLNNSIRSSRYSFWSFFPRQLFFQFTKLANFYFLVVAILQMIPGLSTTGTFTTLIPLLIFVGISMGKEGFDDWRRYRLDKEENNRFAFVLRPGSGTASAGVSVASESHDWVEVKWKDIRVGDVIKLERDQPIPADLVLLHANGHNGVAYIETMALDGETNLKNKQPIQPVAKVCASVDDINSNSVHFAVEDPNTDLYKFDGHVSVNAQERLPLTNNEIVYRGSILRNTDRALGMVIYTGEECKIRMNANKNPRIKKPTLQGKVNRVVMLIVLLVVILAVACTIAYKFWAQDVQARSWYLIDAAVSYGPVFTSFLIMFNTMIPISLYVSMEIVKVVQMFLLNDIDMYDPETNTPLEARTSTINEELGQVSYIFSDKTGTLTNNSMRFRKISVAGTAWLHDADLQEETAGEETMLMHKKRRIKGKKALSRKSNASSARMGAARPSNLSTGLSAARRPSRPAASYRTAEMLQYIQRKPYTVFARKAKLFILSLALCHTCIPEEDESGAISFQAASPDELALVMAARDMGYLVSDRQSNTLTIRTHPNGPNETPVDEVYEILDVIEFSSARKRMSVVVRMPDQRICLFCKGADTTLMQLLKRAELAQEKALEIERRVSRRKAAEANIVIRRNSEYQSRKDSGVRSSLSRPSFSHRRSSVRRSSISGQHASALRDSVDIWLRDRETDGGILNRETDSEYYSPRPSAQMGRFSSALSDSGSSTNGEEDEDLVEEALVLNEAAVFERCFQHLNDFATEGLRTLLYGHRFLDETTYSTWKAAYHDASTSLVDRQEKIEEVGQQIEQQLELTGATAIEDKLQKGVPEAIDKLRRANIKMWMLTGDKRETAINVGHSCRLVKDYSTLTILDHEVGDVEESIVRLTADIARGSVAHSVVVVDGQTLSTIEADETMRERFFQLAIRTESVICCRASPKQKAFLVRSIRKYVNDAITLAIGDGANDIAMIQEAHVGIGITGKEGLQAARISDYSIAQFRFLLKLLLVHGRWNYMRACKYTLGTFWKEMLFYLTQALYQRWNGYTGTSLYEPWSLSMFNTLFTSLAVIFLGIFTKDLAASTLLAVPELYTKGQRHGGFNMWLYLGWSFMATCEAVIIFFTMFGLYGMAVENPTGNDTFALGLLTFSACITVINLKLQALEVHNKTYLSLIVIIISVGGWFLWNLILSQRYKLSSGKGVYDVPGNFIHESGHNLLFWVVWLCAVIACLLFELTVSTLRALFFPNDVDLFQEMEQDLDIRKRFEEAAAPELQQSWNHGTKKSSLEIALEAEEMDAREQQVQELLARRRSTVDTKLVTQEIELDGYTSAASNGHNDTAPGATPDGYFNRRASTATGVELEPVSPIDGPSTRRRSVEIHELFSKGFGAVRKGRL
ncbi:hypothetical protein N7510_003678 [Penicillium lagena]|uniref:uncharacterized protein n=1 Tax=Penicillium lagena TaxID=94218 RepID=UPI002541E849|nr:uncharacterized protein N7510_003678 [Penicillium lagena]KAJ5619694.1 hypothetical protein N7510_003678 [Penicillium lagena]